MVGKAVQMRRAKKLNRFFNTEFHTQKNVLDVFDRRVQAEGCPMFMVYQTGSVELDARLKNPDGNGRKKFVSLKGMEHVKRTLEKHGRPGIVETRIRPDPPGHRCQRRSLPWLAGTVWGVMSTFGEIAQQGSATMPPWLLALRPRLLRPLPGYSWQFLPCSVTTGWCIICACSLLSWIISRRS